MSTSTPFVVSLLLLLLSLSLVSVSSASSIPDQSWDYETVRPGAHMFWWLYGMTDVNKRSTAPLVVYLQGGPGASSTGFANFLEIGPLDPQLKPRNVTWVNGANVLFIDNPVGTGYSYVDSPDKYATTDKQVGLDLVSLLKAFLEKNPIFKTLPFYIFCESYGGKMTTSFGVELSKALEDGSIEIQFEGVALGDSWISPIDFVDTWADYLLATSEVSAKGAAAIASAAAKVDQAVNEGRWVDATNLWGNVEEVIEDVGFGVNFYNILDRTGDFLQVASDDVTESAMNKSVRRHVAAYPGGGEEALPALMNGPIKAKLGIPQNVTWGGQSNEVFNMMSTAFMQPIVDGVDYLISKGYSVDVYSGNLDLICDTPGTVKWINRLQWSGLSQFLDTTRTSISVNGEIHAFRTAFKNFRLWNILAAGHMVPIDQPDAAYKMLTSIIYQTME